jgi:hypothetical protein
MKFTRAVYSLLLLLTFQYSTFARKQLTYYQRAFEEELLDAISRNSALFTVDSDETSDRLSSSEDEVDLDNHVNIELWNQLNDEDIKNMPPTDDYSSEVVAARWLQWYTTITKRYRQVYHQKLTIMITLFILCRWALYWDGIITPI